MKRFPFRKYFFFLLCILYLCLLLPLLYIIPSLLAFMTGLELLKSISFSFVLFGFFALILSAIFSLFRYKIIEKLVFVFGAVILYCVFSLVLIRWIYSFCRIPSAFMKLLGFLFLIFLALVPVLSLYLYKRGKDLMRLFNTKFEPIEYCFIALFLFSFLFIIPNLFHSARLPRDRISTCQEISNPNVIIIVLDALSAYHLEMYGYAEAKTPCINNLANESCVFMPMIASANYTSASIPSILTGKTPLLHKVFSFEWHLPRAIEDENILNILAQNGYETYSVVQNPLTPLSSFGLYKWIDQESYPAFDATIFDKILGFTLRISSKMNLHAYVLLRKWMGFVFCARKGGRFEFTPLRKVAVTPYQPRIAFDEAYQFAHSAQRPFFIFIHIFPPHEPFLPPNAYSPELFDTGLEQANFMYHAHSEEQIGKINVLRDLYNRNIEYVDKELGEFISLLKISGIYNNSIIILTSDHGETFVPDWVGHSGSHLFEPMIRVPLMIKFANQNHNISPPIAPNMIDLSPTILASLNIPIPEWMEGESLMPYILDNKRQKETPTFCMHLWGNKRNSLTKGTICLIDTKKLLFNIETGETKLTDPSNDPYDSIDISLEHPEKRQYLEKYLFQYLEKNGLR